MDVILTTKCNLKCDGCCYLFNKYKDGEFLDADKIIANMNKIKPSLEKYRTISVIGGETFLYPDLVKICDYIKDLDIDQCAIFTNGTIYPNYIEELCKTMNNKFHIIIGGYGNEIVKKKLCDIFTKYNISHVIRPDDDDWIEHGDFIDHKEPKIKFCDFRYLTLMKDRIYACGRFAQAVNLGLIDIKNMSQDEYIDINDKDVLAKIDKMMEESYYKFTSTCKYCLRGTKKGTNRIQGS